MTFCASFPIALSTFEAQSISEYEDFLDLGFFDFTFAETFIAIPILLEFCSHQKVCL